MAVEIICDQLYAKVSDQTGNELAASGSAVRHMSAIRHCRHVTVCAARPFKKYYH